MAQLSDLKVMLSYQICWVPRDICCLPRLLLAEYGNLSWIGIIALDIKPVHFNHDAYLRNSWHYWQMDFLCMDNLLIAQIISWKVREGKVDSLENTGSFNRLR